MFSIAIWSGGNAIADVSYTPKLLTISSDWAFFGGILSLFWVLFLVDLLLDRKFPPLPRLALYGLPCIILSLFGFSSYGIAGISFPPNAPAQIVPGVIYSIALFFYIFGLGYSCLRLILGLTKEHDHCRRMQFLYVLIGLLVVMFSQMLFDVLLPLLGELQFFDLGPMMSIVFALGFGYTIERHQLLDIRIIVQRGLIYTLMLGIIICLYIGLTFGIGDLLIVSANVNILWSGIITVVVGIFGTPVIESYFSHLTDPFFFKEGYDYAEAMHLLSQIPQTTGNFDELISTMENSLKKILRSSSICITFGTQRTELGEDTGNELLSIPIEIEDSIIGYILVGEKLSGESYTRIDLKLLRTFAFQAATALSRASMYKEMQRHAEDLEEKVEKRTSTLRAMQEGQRKMLIEISHNLQTPLAIFQTKLDRMRKSVPYDDEIRSMEQSIVSLSDFIYDLLALSLLEGTLEREENIRVSLSCLLEEITEEMNIITADQGISITSTIVPDIFIKGNKKRLSEVVMNLANNSVKYMGTSEHRELSFILSKNNDVAQVVIADTGMGIPSEDLPHIFERFYRSCDISNAGIRGTGLGLSIVKQIVERHGGSITAESTLGIGSSFAFTIPYIP
jgi:signal transduction histidine kinase